ncbi:hypothetical protein [Moraxella lacunata]|uniref:hypothetical protein n=1 Tax=Moraxella lacunata TaxID=477 RepID=UPI003EE14505
MATMQAVMMSLMRWHGKKYSLMSQARVYQRRWIWSWSGQALAGLPVPIFTKKSSLVPKFWC